MSTNESAEALWTHSRSVEDLLLDARPATERDRTTLENLVQLYLHDLSPAGDWDVDSAGRFEDRPLRDLWVDPHRQPFILSARSKLAGFAVVTVDPAGTEFEMSEFFILRRWRRSGVGTGLARKLLTERAGTWIIKPFAPYPPAESFWRAVLQTLMDDGLLSESGVFHDESGGTVIRLVTGTQPSAIVRARLSR